MSSKPVVLHAERSNQRGAFILAANHVSPYEVPLVIRHSSRQLDFVSITEVFRYRFVAWFYGSMNAFPIDRSRPDLRGMRTILDRLKRHRAVAMFPEGAIRSEQNSITHGGKVRPGIGRLAVMAGVPILPCVVINGAAYCRLSAWLPIRRVRYGIIFGEPISMRPEADKERAAKMLEAELENSMVRLYRELVAEMQSER
jgi:1-acyl-sn-glycerol-3-phosphate acyltransferase